MIGRRLRMVLIGFLIAAMSVSVLSSAQHRPTSPHEGLTPWEQGHTYGPWAVRYSGYGSVHGNAPAASGNSGDAAAQVMLEPRQAEDRDITHGALVHTTATCQDPEFAVTVRTESQLRQGTPNPWEVGWVLWNFENDVRFYAVALKPNGWEVSKQDAAYPGNQRFLATGTQPAFPVGQAYRVQITQQWPRMTVSVDGVELATVIDTERPYRGGAVALYTEDARVRFSDFDLPACQSRHAPSSIQE